MTILIDLLFKALGPPTLRQFRDQCRRPEETQEELLLRLLRVNADTEFGRRHGFAGIASAADYRQTVPITTYEDLRPYVDAALEGKPAQLTAESPVLFATTSGTTGKPKYIPVTRASRSAKSRLMRVWLAGMHLDHRVFSGQVLTVVSPEVESRAPCGTPCGAESGHGYRNMPPAVQSLYCAPYEVYEVHDYDAKYYSLLRLAAARDISLIYTCNPSTILLMARRLGEHTESILRDVRDGTLNAELDIEWSLRQKLAAGLKPDPNRAHQLARAATQGDGVLLPQHVWPNLKAIACWKGGTVGMYLEQMDRYFPAGLPVRDIGYFASELRGSVPLSDDSPSGVLAIPTNFCEFFPADADHKPAGTDLLGAHELEEGGRYYVYATTAGGLYRYDMNDIIEVTGFHERTPLIRFLQKGKGVVSFTGEKLYETQVIAAVHDALDEAGPSEFITAVGELVDQTPRYVFLIEFEKTPEPAVAQGFLRGIEEALRQTNIEYATKRDSRRLDPPVLRLVAPGEFDRYRRRVVLAGKADGQFKILRLTTDVEFAAEFRSAGEVQLGGTNPERHDG